MSTCWYCYWGWPKANRDIYLRAAGEIGESSLEYGPSHTVWEDENFDTLSIESCLRDGAQYRGDLTDDEFEVVIRSLTELLAVPEEMRDCCPRDYDGLYPENFPPPSNVPFSYWSKRTAAISALTADITERGGCGEDRD